MGRNKIPDGWLDYAPIKDVITETRIVPFKSPLRIQKFEADKLRKHKWTVSDVLCKVPDLKLVIDLTCKDPGYYEPVEFLEKGVDFVKLKCPGQIIPPPEIIQQFLDCVDKFFHEHRNGVVGVHCTHGVNRTGYVICRYLMERRGYATQEALDKFLEMRGYALERENYIQELRYLGETA